MKTADSLQLIGIGFSTIAGTLAVLPDQFHWLAYPISAIGVGLILYGIIGRIRFNIHWISDPRARFPMKLLVSFQDAARLAYEKFRYASHAGKSDFGNFVEDLNNNDPLSYYYAFTYTEYFSIYGKHPPSTKFELIPLDKFKSGQLKWDGNEVIFKLHNEAIPQYISLCVERKSLKRYLKERSTLKINS
jgi:hypothetical protein